MSIIHNIPAHELKSLIQLANRRNESKLAKALQFSYDLRLGRMTTEERNMRFESITGRKAEEVLAM